MNSKINKIRIIIPVLVIGVLIFASHFLLLKNDLILKKTLQPLLILVFSLFTLLLYKEKIQIPLISEKQEKLFFKLICTIILIELSYFGIPLLGHISYADFGFPIFHHTSLMLWILILFGRKKNKYFIIHTLFCLLIFNRQLILFGVLSYLFSNKIKINFYSSSLAILFITFFLGIGYYRNFVLDVEFDPFIGLIELPYLEFYDFILFYIIGPYNASFGNVHYQLSQSIFNFWNTEPEWIIFSLKYKIPKSLSFVFFYGIIIVFLFIIKRIKSSRKFYYAPIIIIYSYFTFFSTVLFTSVFLANILMLELIFLLSKFNNKDK